MSIEFENDLRVRAVSVASRPGEGAALAVTADETTAVLVSSDAFWNPALAWLVEAEGVRVVARASELERVQSLVTSLTPDLLLVQAHPDLEPARLYKRLRQARKARPELRIVVVCERGDSRLRDCALAGGAARVVDIERAGAILGALRSVHIADGVAERPLLTRRELEILRLVAEGRTNRDVAELLWVSDQTVKFHLANVYRKLGVKTRAEAVEWARKNDVAGVVAAEDRLAARPRFPSKLH
jgi:DNA-binding NarL/FixJ family response regulator